MPIRTRSEDTTSENQIASLMETRWDCAVHRTGYLDAWDYIGVKDGRTVFIAELKTRNNPSTQYPTVYLSAHKWITLLQGALGLGVTPLFIVRFTDVVMYKRITEIDARKSTMAGRFDRPDAPNDVELMILVPVSEMRVLA